MAGNQEPLKPEQELGIKAFAASVEKMSPEEVKRRLATIHEAMLYMDSYYQQKIARAWGVKIR
ncbi:MAG: hypothetical protein KME29_04685 [Calothrix sp. FI2-JRJ7]|jgi:hypothetical protein|nr:hypothetical protein [Calothrix sp. FI2-JRJ7]